ncbi:MAG: hypothetical protein ACKVOU_01350 [Cytophagales bacterium]
MKLRDIICLTFLLSFTACSSTKTTKVYIEVGVNDYTRSQNNAKAVESGKSKKLNAGIHDYHAIDTSKPISGKKHHH